MNFLGNLQLPQFAPGQLVEGMGGLDQSLARNAQLGQQQQQRPKKPFAESTFGRILGALGDALLVNSGRAPMYAPMLAQRREEERQNQANEAIGNYLGNLDPGLRDLIMQAGPGAAMQAYGLAHPKASEQPGIAREFDWYSHLPEDQRAAADKFIEQRRFNPFMAPITLGPGDVYDPGNGQPQGGDLPSVSSPEEAAKLPPGTKFRLPDGRIGTVPGGPAASPPATFP